MCRIPPLASRTFHGCPICPCLTAASVKLTVCSSCRASWCRCISSHLTGTIGCTVLCICVRLKGLLVLQIIASLNQATVNRFSTGRPNWRYCDSCRFSHRWIRLQLNCAHVSCRCCGRMLTQVFTLNAARSCFFVLGRIGRFSAYGQVCSAASSVQP